MSITSDDDDIDDEAAESAGARSSKRQWGASVLRRRKAAVGCAGILLLLIAFGCWLTFEAWATKSHLEQARTSAQRAKDALLKGDAANAVDLAGTARTNAQSARASAHSLPCNIAAAIPWLGSPFETGQQITDVVQDLAANVLEPLAATGESVALDQLIADGRVDVQSLRAQEPILNKISASASKIDADAHSISEPAFLSAMLDARTRLQQQTSDVAGLLRNAALAARIAPSLMGADGPRTYFMGFQTNAEARGTGGLLGGFGIIRFDNGIPSIDALAPNTQLDKTFSPIDLGPEYTDLYGFGDPTTDFRNSNFSPHFPYAAQIWKSMWAQQTGVNVDGAIAIDPVALSYVLGAVGSVTLADGEVVTSDNVVELTESTAYVRFPDDQPARKQYLQNIAQQVVQRMTEPLASPRQLLDALGRAVDEGRIAVWSATSADQLLLEETPLAHSIPDDTAPYAAVVVNNLGGNKLDYYLRRSIMYSADGCERDTRNSVVSVNLASNAPPGLPDYVAASPGIAANAPITIPAGTMVTSVRLIGTKGATLKSAYANNQRVPVFQGSERGHPTFEVQVAIPPGKSGDLIFNLIEPTSGGGARVPVQPLLDSSVPVVTVPECFG